jgi:molecular chaperone GrpE
MVFREQKVKEQDIPNGDDELEQDLEQDPNATRIAELELALDEARDQLLRRTAEMDNMRRRFNLEREQLIFESNKRLLAELLTTLDDMERTLEHADAGKEAVVQGMDLIYKNLLKLLDRYGVTPMETVGKTFDVHAHDALMEEATNDVPPGTITKEIQKGYWLNDSVLRHAKVVVAKEQD